MSLSATIPCSVRSTRSAAAADLGIDLRRTLLVSTTELLPPMGLRFVALPGPVQRPAPGVQYFRFERATNPLRWDPELDAVIRNEIDVVCLFLPNDEIGSRTYWRLQQLGVQRVAMIGSNAPSVDAPWRQAIRQKLGHLQRQAKRTLMQRFSPSIEPARVADSEPELLAALRSLLEVALPRRRPANPNRLRIAHFVSSLNSGGAERQVCYAASGQQSLGHDAEVWARWSTTGQYGHYLPLLQQTHTPVRTVGKSFDIPLMAEADFRQNVVQRCRRLPIPFAQQIMDLVNELTINPVDVLHCYVDDCNSVGSIAGLLTGVPVIVLSFRNGNPSNFPGLHQSWFRPAYHAVIGRPGLALSSNSKMGANDYERWLGLPTDSVPVIRNAFVPPPLPTADAVHGWRRRHGLPDDVPVVAGVFRLDKEKRPLRFIECIARIKQALPNLRAFHAGIGIMQPEMERAIRDFGLESTVTMLGQSQEVPLLMAASDLFLLVSEWEGVSNALLESQYFGCPPVATRAGGAEEAIVQGQTGIIVEHDDFVGASHAVIELLQDPSRRSALQAAGPDHVTKNYAPIRLHETNLNLYREIFVQRFGDHRQAA